MSKIPSQAKSVFKGEIFEVFQWEQELFDGTTRTFEMLKRPYSAEVIPVVNGQILLAEQEQPGRGIFWSLFGGMVEPNESMLEAAKRELREESGYESTDWELVFVDEPFFKMDYADHIYVARKAELTTEPRLDGGEKITVHAVDFATFVEKITSDTFRGSPAFKIAILKMRLAGPDAVTEFQKQLGAR